MSSTIAATPAACRPRPPGTRCRRCRRPRRAVRTAVTPGGGGSLRGGLSRRHQHVLPGAVQAGRHQVVHQVVAARDAVEHVVDQRLLVAGADAFEAVEVSISGQRDRCRHFVQSKAAGPQPITSGGAGRGSLHAAPGGPTGNSCMRTESGTALPHRRGGVAGSSLARRITARGRFPYIKDGSFVWRFTSFRQRTMISPPTCSAPKRTMRGWPTIT